MEYSQIGFRRAPLSKEASLDWEFRPESCAAASPARLEGGAQNEPIHTVKAKPLENDISEWHCTLLPNEGPYQGIPFHLILTFPSDYPNRPPCVRLCSCLTHPNVSCGGYICLDMIKEPKFYAGPYQGWSTAYSVQSILLQLQSFLFAENVPQESHGSKASYTRNWAGKCAADIARNDAAAFSCRVCGFKGSDIVAAAPLQCERERAWERARMALEFQRASSSNNPFNLLGALGDVSESDLAAARSPARARQRRAPNPAVSASQNPVPAPTAADRLSELPTDVLVQVMDRLDAPALSALVRAGKYYARAATERGAWVRRELQCFHSKRSFAEEVLGFGLEIKGLNSPARWEGVLLMDYLSAGAFFEGNVRKGVWNEMLTWWLPLILDAQHCARALPLLKGIIKALATDPWRAVLTRGDILDMAQTFSPLDTLKVLPRLMNGMVVSFMKQEEAKKQWNPYSFMGKEGAGQQGNLHASEKALLGYCQLHHMLLRLAQDYPEIRDAIDRALSRFQDNTSARQKNETPDLGELLVLLSVAKTGGVTWASLAPAFMGESFDRNVLWLLKSHPELAVLENTDHVSDYRMVTTFKETTVSRRLIMFQVAFLLLRYGYPRPGLTRKLQKTWYDVLKVATWTDYYAQLGLACPPTPLALCSTLRQSVVSSSQKGYHSIKRLWHGRREDLMQLRWRYEPAMRTQYHTCLI
ncbi:hypothetical protein KFL_001990055 [Klebsormidium nitens]|uniref:Ubiquitin-conjugating enzyme family protein n=1 Tax=Klebsormidium nitens TaxID=105231 RepID=A0A1Y1I3W3_KLENI|nr:hypothetical protein KFL_001990055 [Klebsormidium nitens]|eukprot:GAQ84652.1 hypothetical protein KFL_001990055 [Klebsormidium nitens]